jgi:hypothetical protein
MWSVVRELVRSDERAVVRDALEEIASPLDTYGWSSSGIYVFWDPTGDRSILYIGMAVDLPQRIGQHFGLVGCRRRAASEIESKTGSRATQSWV